MNVNRIMTKSVKACGPADTLDCAARIMWEEDCGCVPVIDTQRQVVGMLTDRDICMSALFQGRALHEIPVNEAMSHEVFACHEGDETRAVEKMMQDKQVRRVPVLDKVDQLVGLVSLHDLTREAGRDGARGKGISSEEVSTTLAAVSRRRNGSNMHHH